MSRVVITLTPENARSAGRALRARGMIGPDDFHTGPTFTEATFAAGPAGCVVTTEDKVEYIYPWHTVARVKVAQ